MSMLPYFYDMERPFGLMECDFFNPISPCFPMSQRHVPREFLELSPWENAFRPWSSLVKPMEQISAAMSRLASNDVSSKITTDEEKFQVNVDVQHFSPDEISVKVVDSQVIVEGKHEEKRDEHGYVARHFQRRYVLPKGCLPDTVQSKLSSDGVLTVTAPKVLPMPSVGERIVPITQTGPVKKQKEGEGDLSEKPVEKDEESSEKAEEPTVDQQ